MSEHFFYVHLKFIPKIVTHTLLILGEREVVVEVSKRLVQQRKSESVNEDLGEKEIALDLARSTALGTLPASERLSWLYDEEEPTWYEHRHHVMNERPCDNEENSARAWRIA